MNKPEVIIIGAGAIGRGYLPWVFADNYDMIFVDQNEELVEKLNSRGAYSTYMVINGRLQEKLIKVKRAYTNEKFCSRLHSDAKAVFINVGPRNSGTAAGILDERIQCPIIVCENDRRNVELIRNLCNKEKVVFAVPDVITSNTAPQYILENDPLAVVTEAGTLFIEKGIPELQGVYTECDESELAKQWTAKLFLHNTPHCVAAYLGAWLGLNYIHEAMAVGQIAEIVRGVMNEMIVTLKRQYGPSESMGAFFDWYAEKEIKRFSCELLFDPISRVAREPLRKLELEGRLVGAAQLCLANGVVPKQIFTGIASALLFNNQEDPDHHLSFMLRALPTSTFLTHVLGLTRGEALERSLSQYLDPSTHALISLRQAYQSAHTGNLKKLRSYENQLGV